MEQEYLSRRRRTKNREACFSCSGCTACSTSTRLTCGRQTQMSQKSAIAACKHALRKASALAWSPHSAYAAILAISWTLLSLQPLYDSRVLVTCLPAFWPHRCWLSHPGRSSELRTRCVNCCSSALHPSGLLCWGFALHGAGLNCCLWLLAESACKRRASLCDISV